MLDCLLWVAAALSILAVLYLKHHTGQIRRELGLKTDSLRALNLRIAQAKALDAQVTGRLEVSRRGSHPRQPSAPPLTAAEKKQIRDDIGVLGGHLGYAPFFARLGLSAAQIDQWFAIEEESWGRIDDIGRAARAQGLSLRDPSVNQMITEEKQRMVDEKRDLIGAEKWKQFEDWINVDGLGSYSAQTMLEPIQEGLANSEQQQLTFDQQRQMGKLLKETGLPSGPGSGPRDAYWNKVFVGSAAVLDPDQGSVLRNVSTEWKFAEAVMEAGGDPR